MSQESTVNKFKKTKYTILGPLVGASIALFLSQHGFDVEMSIGYILGLCIGISIDADYRKNRSRQKQSKNHKGV